MKVSDVKQIVSQIRRVNRKNAREAILFALTLLKVQLVVWVVPLRFYFDRYFGTVSASHPDLQLFAMKSGLYTKVLKLMPFRFSCLVRSMAIQDALKRHGIYCPIHIGIRYGDILDAHAWNEHQKVKDYIKII